MEVIILRMTKEITFPIVYNKEAKIERSEVLMLYEDMVLGRSFEDMCAQMYYRGKMFGFVHLYNGQRQYLLVSLKL